MRLLLLLFTFSTLISAQARDVEKEKETTYTIVSDTYTSGLKKGELRVKGQILDPSGSGIAGTLVCTIDERVSVYSGEYGYYEMMINDTDTSIYIYRQGYKEVAMDYYDFKWGRTVVVNFRPPLNNDRFINPRSGNVSLKPVIYLYSTTSMQVSLALDYLGELTFTYPEYNEGWNVNVDANGIHTANNEKSYPYLFWEGEMEGLAYETEDDKLIGELIATDTLIEYLEAQLSAIGLNRTEQTDFITFWAPRMIDEDYVFVQFLVDDLYTEKVAELTVSPQPESMKRVYLLYTQLDENPQIEFTPQVFEPFKREGFTLIEWGGSNIDITEINL